MQFSESTLATLKSFAGLNPQVHFRKGNVVRTINESQTIMVEATIDEQLPVDFALYDLGNFLAVLSLDDTFDLSIDTAEVRMLSQDQKTVLTYRCCDLKFVRDPFEKNLSLPSKDCEVSLTEKDIVWALKAAAVLQSPQIALVCNGQKLTLEVLDAANDSSNRAIRELKTTDKPAFKALFKVENWRMIPGDYTLTISLKGVGHFQHTTKKLQYWMSLEAGSKRAKTA